MKTRTLLGLMTAALTLLNACTLDPQCEWTDLYPEFENYTIIDGLDQADIIMMGPEFDPSLTWGTEYIIKTDSAYDALTQFSRDENCNYCNYPEIDFDQFFLVGFTMEINCQALNYLKVSETANGLRYALKTVDQTLCNSLLCDNYSFNWVLVPISYDSLNVEFETGVARYFCDC